MTYVPSTELRPLLRGLNALLVGLPLALLVCVPGAVGDWIRLFVIVLLEGNALPGMWVLALLPSLFAIGLLVVAVWQLGRFRTDVKEWQVLDTVTLEASPQVYLDHSAAEQPMRFYQLRLVE